MIRRDGKVDYISGRRNVPRSRVPKGAPSLSDRPESAAGLRERAAHIRRLATELVWDGDRNVLHELADELEARASALERGGG